MENEIEIEVNTINETDLDGMFAEEQAANNELLSGVECPMLSDSDLDAWAADYEG